MTGFFLPSKLVDASEMEQVNHIFAKRKAIYEKHLKPACEPETGIVRIYLDIPDYFFQRLDKDLDLYCKQIIQAVFVPDDDVTVIYHMLLDPEKWDMVPYRFCDDIVVSTHVSKITAVTDQTTVEKIHKYMETVKTFRGEEEN